MIVFHDSPLPDHSCMVRIHIACEYARNYPFTPRTYISVGIFCLQPCGLDLSRAISAEVALQLLKARDFWAKVLEYASPERVAWTVYVVAMGI